MSTKNSRRSQTVAPGNDYNLHYVAPPTIQHFLRSNAFIQGLMGPFRSGKSSGCSIKLYLKMCQQRPGVDGIRRSRWIITRNTYGELETTTLKTFLDWFPPEHFGELKMGMPITYYMSFDDVQAEIWFLALDKPGDRRKLESLEVTGAWINEAREIPKVIVDHLRGRVAQFPALKDGGCTWGGIIMDTNPPAEDHWWPKLFGDRPVETGGDIYDPFAELGYKVDYSKVKMELFKQPSGLATNAENVENLNEGRDYYVRLAHNQDRDFVDVYVHGKYGSVQAGKPVYPGFNKDIHVSKIPLQPNPNWPLFLGWDYGLTPACLIKQLTPQGQLRVLREVIGDGIDVRAFAMQVVQKHLSKDFARYEIVSTGDPSGSYRSPTDSRTCEDILRQVGIPTQSASTQSVVERLDAVNRYLRGFTYNGQPALQIDPSCRMLIYGFERGYRYTRVKVEGQERFTDKIDKQGNPYTHVHDALQYGCLRVSQHRIAPHVRRAAQYHHRHTPADPAVGY